jgi:hypothetical protein
MEEGTKVMLRSLLQDIADLHLKIASLQAEIAKSRKIRDNKEGDVRVSGPPVVGLDSDKGG